MFVERQKGKGLVAYQPSLKLAVYVKVLNPLFEVRLEQPITHAGLDM